MVNRRTILIGGGAGALALATGMAGQLFAAAPASSPASLFPAAPGPLGAAPAPFAALADTLSGSLGLDAVLVNRVYAALSPLVPGIDAKAAKLATALGKLAAAKSAAPAQDSPAVNKIAALNAEEAGLGDLFLRLTSAIYLGTVDVAPKQRECIAFETVASYQVVSAWVQPPSYCTGEPNFWAHPPVTDTTPPVNAHV